MKIRIKGNSIRLRLSKSEVDVFAAEGIVEEATEFGNDTLVYAVKSYEAGNMSAEFVGGNVTIFIPKIMVQNWVGSDLVGLDYDMPVKNEKYLSILVEKDFKCMDAVIKEDQSDYFENPSKSC
ncbi:MAG: hypothetical protein ABIO82_08125 [Ginsengibacter sp.]